MDFKIPEDYEDSEPSGRRYTRPTLIGAILILILVGGYFLVQHFIGVRLSITLNDTHELSAGNPITYRGLTIGKIRDVGLSPEGVVVQATFSNEFKDYLRTGSTFLVQPGIGMELKVWDESSPLLARGATVEGADNYAEYLALVAERKGKEWWETFFSIDTFAFNSTINQDGLLETEMQVGMGEWIPVDLLLSVLGLSDEQWARDIVEREGGKDIKVLGSFSSPLDGAWGSSELTFHQINSNLLWTDYEFSQSFSPGSLSGLFELPEFIKGEGTIDWAEWLTEIGICVAQPEMCDLGEIVVDLGRALLSEVEKLGDVPLKGLQFEISLDMPGQLLESNAPQKRGGQVVWLYSGKELSEGTTLIARSRIWNPIPLAIGGVIILIIVGVVVWGIYRRRSEAAVEEMEGTDTGSVFD